MKKVLLVDDEPDAFEVAQVMLEEIDGIVIDTAPDGETALKRIAESTPDLVILDVEMPGMSGFHVFTELRKGEATRELPVVMLTA